MPPMQWNPHLYTLVLLLSMMVFVLRTIPLSERVESAGYSLRPVEIQMENKVESYITAAAAESSTIAF